MNKLKIILKVITLVFISVASCYAQSGWEIVSLGTTADLNGLCECAIRENGRDMGERIFIVGDSGKVFYSDDQGLEWKSVANPYLISLHAISFSGSDTGYIVGENGELLSITRENDEYTIIRVGNLYGPESSGQGDLNDITSCYYRNFYCVGDSGKIFRSVDGGSSWTPYPIFSLVSHKLQSIYCNCDYQIYIAGDSGTILRSPRANVWEIISPPQEHNTTNFYDIVFNDNFGWTIGEKGTILYSQTYGYTWVSQESGVNVTLRGLFFYGSCNTPSGCGWAVGDSGVILKTTDWGSNWERTETGVQINLRQIHFIDQFVGIAIGENGTILRTVTGGSSLPSFEALPNSLLFGSVVLDSLKKGNIIVSNNGVVPLEISDVYSDNSYFAVSPNVGTVPPFGYFVFNLDFSPDHYGNFKGNITFTSNAPGSPHVASVSGVGSGFPKSGWQWQNPIPHGNNLNDIEHIGDNTVICVGEMGSVVKSTDNGVSWSSQSFAGGTLNNLTKICFVNNELGFSIGEYGTIIKTTDSGEKWIPIKIGTTQSLNGISFADDQNGFVVGSDFGLIYGTTDGGNSWQLQHVNPGITLYDVDVLTPLIAVAVGCYSNYIQIILQTTDGGISWQKRFTMPYYRLRAVKFVDDSTVVSVGQHSILRSVDRGFSWEILDYDYHSLTDVSFADNLRGIAVGADDIMITYDGGLTWSDFSLEGSWGFQSVHWTNDDIFSIMTNYYNGLSVIKKSTNDGISWDKIAPIGVNSSLRSVSFYDDMNGIAAGDSGKILTTSNGGEKWIQRLAGTSIEIAGLPFKSVCTVSSSEFAAVGNNGLIIFTSDGGTSWENQYSGTIRNLNTIFYYDGGHGWVAADGGIILATTNLGKNWMDRTGTNTKDLFSVCFPTKETGIAVGDQGTILRTTNGGADWIPVSSGTSSALFSIAMHNDSGYAVGPDGIVLQTTDLGETWNRLMFGTSENYYSVNMISGDLITIVGELGTILQTTDGGKTWNSQESGTGNDLYAMYFNNEDIGTVVGEGGTVLRTTTGGVVSVRGSEDKIEEIPNEFALYQNYPNPFNSETVISFALPRHAKVTIMIYDIIGREVARLEKGPMPPGTHQIAWNAAGLSSGVYLYKMEAGTYTAVNRMLFVK